MSTLQTVSAAVARELERHSSQVFGLMGNGNAWFLDAVVRRGAMAFTSVRHEAGAVAAADAYSRAGGGLGIATVTYGAGFTNAVTPLAEAALARSPLVLVAGDAPTGGRRPFDVDQTMIAAGLHTPTVTVQAASPAADAAEAVRLALVERTPVVLALPYDVSDAAAPSEPHPAMPSLPSPIVPNALGLAEIASRLAAASRPLIVAGRGAFLAAAQTPLRELARQLPARTASSALGSGLFDNESTHLGICGGFASERAAAAIAQADAVLIVGAGLNAFQTRFGDAFAADAFVAQIDVSEGATNARVDHFVQGDARLASEMLLDSLGELSDQAPGGRPGTRTGWEEAGFADTSGIARERPSGDASASDGRLDPRSLFRELERILPADKVVVQDGGHFIGWAPTYLSIADPERFVMVGTALQSIGLGLPSAVGAAAARPDAVTVLVSGDGGALMGLADLDTVVRTVRHGVVIICNDAAYGAEVHQYAVRGVAESPMLIEEVDFAAVARAFGAESKSIGRLDDLSSLKTWLAAGARGVFVVDCRVSREVVAPYLVEVREAAIRQTAAPRSL